MVAMTGSGVFILTAQVAGRLRKMYGSLPCCKKCGRPLKVSDEYYSRNARRRAYYHVRCWERAAYADRE